MSTTVIDSLLSTNIAYDDEMAHHKRKNNVLTAYAFTEQNILGCPFL